jgi:hypothetical protein
MLRVLRAFSLRFGQFHAVQTGDQVFDDLLVRWGDGLGLGPGRRADAFLDVLQHVDQHLGCAEIRARRFVDELSDDRFAHFPAGARRGKRRCAFRRRRGIFPGLSRAAGKGG